MHALGKKINKKQIRDIFWGYISYVFSTDKTIHAYTEHYDTVPFSNTCSQLDDV